MSTCSRKCTPPRRSRPRYMGLGSNQPSDRIQGGEAGSRLSATV
ncbi:Uncharacterised protein [Bordetella pertussis]|nr:Uncharacterised protein [Bordetella pertussis]